MVTIVIGSKTFDTYADLEDAEHYLEAAVHADTWRSESSNDKKARALVTATRLLDRQNWKGTKVDDGQALAWPRTGTGVDGVAESMVPEQIVNATVELALALLDGSEVQSEKNTAQKLQSIKAGSVALTYFRGAEGKPTRFPTIVQELVSDLLAGSPASLIGKAFGTSGTSSTADNFGFNKGI